MGKYIKKFDTHSDYEDFVQTEDYIRPNISHCVLEDEVHYNRYFLTPKQFVEYRYSFIKSLNQKFYTYRKQHMNIDFKSEYENISLYKMSGELDKLKIYDKGLRYGVVELSTYSYTDASFTNGDNGIIDFGVINNLILGLRIDSNNHYLIGDASLYKTDEIYNENDVFYIPLIDIYEYDYEDDEEKDAIKEEAMYGDNIVLLCPHNTYANFTIAYPDGNGGYTTTKPSSLTWTLTITNGTISPNPEWIYLALFHGEDESINTRVDNVVAAMRTDFKKWYNADFSDLSALDDIKLEFPKDIYDFIVNPWKYLNENIIFSYYTHVDLGLPSGTLWAMTNVGTIYNTNYGLYFQWGDTQGYTAEQVGTDKQFSWEDYKFNPSGDGSTMTKYNETDGKTVLDPEDDAARVNWGNSWKMPTEEQCEELLNTEYVTNEWVTDYHGSGVNGRLFTSIKNGNTLFFPAAGNADDGSMDRVNTYGGIWSNSLNSYSVEYSHFLYFTNNNISMDSNGRRLGCSVRAVISQ